MPSLQCSIHVWNTCSLISSGSPADLQYIFRYFRRPAVCLCVCVLPYCHPQAFNGSVPPHPWLYTCLLIGWRRHPWLYTCLLLGWRRHPWLYKFSHLKRWERPVIFIIGTLHYDRQNEEEKSRKSHCRIFNEFICKLWWKISIWSPAKVSQYFVIYPLLAMTEVKRLHKVFTHCWYFGPFLHADLL